MSKNYGNVKYVLILSLLTAFCLSGCNINFLNDEAKLPFESVMAEGDKITATNTFGTLTITAGKDNIRYLTLSGQGKFESWLDDTICIRLSEKKSKENDSLLELRYDNNTKELRCANSTGPTHVKMKESKIYLENSEDPRAGLCARYKESYNPVVCSSGGIYVCWSYTHPEYWFIPRKSYLSIRLLQIYVNGEKPTSLLGAKDDKIKVEHVDDAELQRLKKLTSWF